MNICVIHPRICTESAKELAAAIKADCVNPFEEDRRDFRAYDLVINYGCHRDIRAKQILNSSKSVGICKDKVSTFKILHEHQIPTIGYTTRKADIPKHWECVVIRDKVDGARAEGIEYVYKGEPIPDGALFTEYFPHNWEYRIVVLNGKVVGRYRKDVVEDGWQFTRMLKTAAWKDVDNACIKAAKALGIDYVGFDVLEDEDAKFVILEANSGPIITDESVRAFKQFIKQLG